MKMRILSKHNPVRQDRWKYAPFQSKIPGRDRWKYSYCHA